MDELNGRVGRLRTLTPRERDVLGLVCQGGRNYEEIGTALFISERTVLFHMGNVYEKLGLAELSKADRQRDLGRFCPLLSYLNEEEPSTAPPSEPEPEPEPVEPRSLVLVAVQEDAPPSRRDMAVETVSMQPPEPPIIYEPRTSFWRRVLPFLLVAVGSMVVGALVLNSCRSTPPPPGATGQAPTVMPIPTLPGPTVAPSATSVSAVVVTPVPPVTVVATTRPGTPTPPPTPSFTPTAIPLPPTPIETILRFGQTWAGDRLYVTAKNAPSNNGGSTYMDLSVENQTGQTLNFGVLGTAFSLSTNTGKFYAGRDDKLPFNDFLTGTKRDFTVWFNVSWNDLQAVKLDRQVAWLHVELKDFNTRLPQAQWRDDVIH